LYFNYRKKYLIKLYILEYALIRMENSNLRIPNWNAENSTVIPLAQQDGGGGGMDCWRCKMAVDNCNRVADYLISSESKDALGVWWMCTKLAFRCVYICGDFG
jgi:hypothetical protein